MFHDMLRWLLILALIYGLVYWLIYGRGAPRRGSVPSDTAEELARRARPSTSKPFRPFRKTQFKNPPPDFYKRLLVSCMGDKAKAERLIAYECQRNPSLSREQAIREALDRLEYDSRL